MRGGDVEARCRGIDAARDSRDRGRRVGPGGVVIDVERHDRQQIVVCRLDRQVGVASREQFAGRRAASRGGDGEVWQGDGFPGLLQTVAVAGLVFIDIPRAVAGVAGPADRNRHVDWNRARGNARAGIERHRLNRHRIDMDGRRERDHRGGGNVEAVLRDNEHAAVDGAGVDEPAIERGLFQDRRTGRGGDVDDRDVHMRLPGVVPPRQGGDATACVGVSGADRRPGVFLRDHREPRAVQEE